MTESLDWNALIVRDQRAARGTEPSLTEDISRKAVEGELKRSREARICCTLG